MKYLSIIIPVGIIALLLLFGVSTYNGIVTKNEEATSAWADVESSYQRRFDLIPNLVETVKGYADFEKSTLIAVTEARAAAMGAMRKAGESGDVGEFQQANQNLGVAMGRFFGYTEQYPDLKANQNFMDLQSQLEGTENRINVARDRFNDAVKEYNAKIKRFPGNMFGFETKNYFEAQEGSEQAPKVDFSN